MKIFRISMTNSLKIKINRMLSMRRLMIIEIKRINKSIKIFQIDRAKYNNRNS